MRFINNKTEVEDAVLMPSQTRELDCWGRGPRYLSEREEEKRRDDSSQRADKAARKGLCFIAEGKIRP